ncbi:MAG TPA: N-acetylmuramoyl-L-alanine amidase [Polyangiaceae bacterium]|nr:N-acetylmuramoyl-L-alanine amidase [Polyangiaceae bacterium]HMR75406.1 N-acetylmuramoyl-L-alanine amidase [Polyangiaceae bacterium]
MRSAASRLVIVVVLGANLPASADTAPSWPERPSLLQGALDLPARLRPIRVFLDAGHGAEDNTGNRSAYCAAEQDFTLSLAGELQSMLEAAGFQTRLSRDAHAPVPYAERANAAAAWNADVLISLHSDIRGHAQAWSPSAAVTCLRSREAPGFSVLFSDAGNDRAAGARERAATAIGSAMRTAGFLAYDGAHYGSDYAATEAPGVFVDRHPPGKRIYMLYAPRVPSILIETHNALDDREVRLWNSSATRRAFASALARALGDLDLEPND